MPKGFPFNGPELRFEIEARGWSLPEAAQRFGISEVSLRSYLAGKPASGPKRIRVLRALADTPRLNTQVLGVLRD